MTNGIAPIKEISVGDRISEIETFLGQEELKLTTTEILPPVVTELVPEPVIPIAPIYTEFSPTAVNAEMIDLLRQIIKNQEVERKSYERNNPLTTDNPVYDWLELSTPAGFLATFTLTIPEGFVFLFEYFNTTYRDDTIYSITIDGVTEPTTTEPVMDWADHYLIFRPPRICYRHVIITALNNGDATTTFGCFIRGFFRSTTKVSKEYVGAR